MGETPMPLSKRAAAATDPNVQYAYEDGADPGSADFEAKYVRPDCVTYPGPSTRRKVYYTTAATSSPRSTEWPT